MNIILQSIWFWIIMWMVVPLSVYSQTLKNVIITNKSGLYADTLSLSDSSILILPVKKPLYSFQLNNRKFNTGETSAVRTGDQYIQTSY